MILRQLDNDLIDPYKLDEVLDAVDDYLASYKQPNFYYDTTMYDKFCLFSGIPKSVSDSEPAESEETDSIIVPRDRHLCSVERKNEFLPRFARSVPADPRGSLLPLEERNARQFGEFFEFHPRDSLHSLHPRGYPGYPDYPRQFGVEK